MVWVALLLLAFGLLVGALGGYLAAVRHAPRIVAAMTDIERAHFAKKVAAHRENA